MSQTATLLLNAVVAIGAASALIFQAYKNELSRVRTDASRGARNGIPRPVLSNMLRKVPAFHSCPFTAPAAATIRASPTSPTSSAMTFASSHHRGSDISAPPFRLTHQAHPKPTPMRRS